MSSNKFKPLKDNISNQKSIFQYVMNDNMYVSKSTCFDDTPPFIAYTPRGVQNIDAENELRGSYRINTKCSEYKYIPPKQIMSNPQKLKICNKNDKIRPCN